MDEPRRRQDPLALAVISAAIVLLVALVAGLVLSIRSAPPAAPAAPKSAPSSPSLGERIAALTSLVAKQIADAVREDRPLKVPGTPPAAKRPPVSQPVPRAAPPAPVDARRNAPIPATPAGMTWVYRVSVEPPAWKEATLTYRTVEQLKGIAVYTEFRHASGKMNFQLGMLEAGHPSHAAVRFPGFFMHAAYLDKPLEVGQRFTWEWPWQLPGGAVRAGRVKRFSGEVKAWEEVDVPAGKYTAARIEAALQYIDDGRLMAAAKETLWYSFKFGQVARIVREGRTPDEGSTRIIAELIELR